MSSELARQAALLIRSMKRDLQASKHQARDPVPVDDKTRWVSSETVLAELDALAAKGLPA